MDPSLKPLLEELDYYIHQLDAVGDALVGYIRLQKEHPSLAEEASELYQLLVLDLQDIYNAFKRAYRHRLSMGAARKYSLEELEIAFIKLRDAAERAEARAHKISGYRSREAKQARSSTARIIELAENAAKVLVSEAEKAGRWTAEWEKELGIRRWLR